MNILADDSAVMKKTKELCALIAEDAEYKALLERVAYDPARDRLWFAGDLVNRGPKSLETLRFIRDLGDGAVLRGVAAAPGCRCTAGPSGEPTRRAAGGATP